MKVNYKNQADKMIRVIAKRHLVEEALEELENAKSINMKIEWTKDEPTKPGTYMFYNTMPFQKPELVVKTDDDFNDDGYMWAWHKEQWRNKEPFELNLPSYGDEKC